MFFLIFLVFCPIFCQAIIECNKTVTKLQLCSIKTDYNSRITDSKLLGHPLAVQTEINVFKIAQLDENLNTITLNVLLSVVWNDTRIALESNNKNQYVDPIKPYTFLITELSDVIF